MIKLNSHFKKIGESESSEQFIFKEYIDEVLDCCLDNKTECCHGNLERKFLKSGAIVFLQVSYVRFVA